MFWRFGNYANISTIDTILDKPDVTVEELLDESDLIQELKQQNSKLIEYLRDDNVLERLLSYVIAPKDASPSEQEVGLEPGSHKEGQNAGEGFFSRVRGKSISKSSSRDDDGEESKEEKQRMKYAYVACEILSCEIWSISEALLENQDHLRTFWQYLKQPAPLDPIQAGYFTKVNESLLDRKTAEMLDFFKLLDNVVPDMLQHVDCPMIMDLLLKIISLEKAEGGQGIVDWLQSQNLIPILLSYITAEHSASTQTSAGDFLKAIITISANATTQDQSVIGPNELTRQLVSEACIKGLISEMLKGGNPLTVGVGIVIEVIRKNNSDYDMENQTGPVPKSSDPIYLGTLLRQFANHIPDFMTLVHNPDHVVVNSDGTTNVRKRELKAAFGKKIEPLGFDRFKTCELMAELLHCSNMALLNERGAEADVKRRDADRERLKAEGKLQPARPLDDFSTSVDSHGFHHARAPSSESPEEIKKLEVQNNVEEEEFEKVGPSDAEPEDVRVELEEKEATPTQEPEKERSSPAQSPEHESSGQTTPTLSNPAGQSADSPTSTVLSAKVGGLDLEKEDASMSSPPAQSEVVSDASTSSKQPPSLLTQQLSELAQLDVPNAEPSSPPNTEDRPAPLFSGAHARAKSVEVAAVDSNPAIAHSESGNSEVTPIEDASSTRSIILGSQEYGAHYEVDIDGSPVVGDLLKIQFVENRVVPTIQDFFFRFPWNNFLHNVVYDVVQQVFNGQMDRGFNRSLAIDLFETGQITERIIDGQEASDKAQAETNMRLGYMGHLTLIAEEVLKFTERHPAELLSQLVLDKVMSQQWIDYVEQTLAETRERDNAILGGVRPDMAGGPRQAVLNTINAGGFGGGNNSLASAGLGGSGSIGLDSMDLSNAGGGGGGGFSFSNTNMLSGFNNSSDEEDEEMEENEVAEGRDRDRDIQQRGSGPLSDDEQRHFVLSPPPADLDLAADSTSTTTSLAAELSASPDQAVIPAPLAIPPQATRARMQFAARLAQRKAAMEAERKAAEGAEGDDEAEQDADDGGDDDFRGGEGEDDGLKMKIKVRRPVGGGGGSSTSEQRPDLRRATGTGGSTGPERLSGLFASESSSSEDDEEEEEEGESEAERKMKRKQIMSGGSKKP